MFRLQQVKLCGAPVQHRNFAAAAFSQLWQQLLKLGKEAVASPRTQTPAEEFLKAEAKRAGQFFACRQDLEQKLKLQIASVRTRSSSLELQVAMARRLQTVPALAPATLLIRSQA